MHAFTSYVSNTDLGSRIALFATQFLSGLMLARPRGAAAAAASRAVPLRRRKVTPRNLAADMDYLAWRG